MIGFGMSNKHWNYRVIEFVDPSGKPWRAIHEVYYLDENPISYSENPAVVVWETRESNTAAASSLRLMRCALNKPVLVEKDFMRANQHNKR